MQNMRTLREICTKKFVYRIESTNCGNMFFSKYDRSGNRIEYKFILPCNQKDIMKTWENLKKEAL